jgi:hypothetical protein
MELTSNVCVDGKWFGPDYPKAGDPPAGAVTNPAAFADLDEDGSTMRDEDDRPLKDGEPLVLDQPEEDSPARSQPSRGRRSASSDESR